MWKTLLLLLGLAADLLPRLWSPPKTKAVEDATKQLNTIDKQQKERLVRRLARRQSESK